ncbi:MAG: trans-sulfuration enzyme family protein [Thermoanaerobaculia bacterium]
MSKEKRPDSWRIGTRLVHSGFSSRPDGESGYSLSSPIWQTATFGFDTPEEIAQAGLATHPRTYYTRYGNPNFSEAERTLCDLEGGEAALVTGSGMAAISLVFLGLLKAGDHVVAQKTHYVGTTKLLSRWLPSFGIESTAVDQTDPKAFEAAIRPNTRLIYVETPVNPTLSLTDLSAISALGRSRGIVTCADNTFATPYNQRPIEAGIDLVVHSATKYLSGHSDVTAGAVVGSRERLDHLWEALIVYGMTLHPMESWLLSRGLQTFPLRMERHNRNALEVARFLESHPNVVGVHYPGLPSHPQHELAARQMSGFGGVLSFELAGGYEESREFTSRLRLVRRAVSLGGTKSLAAHAASMVFPHLSSAERAAAGISENLVRLSVGIEDSRDILEDLDGALTGRAPASEAPMLTERASR